VAQDDAARRHGRRLEIGAVDADIADMREGEGDDLPGIGGIGDDLLISRHAGIEAHLANARADRADAFSPKNAAVREHEGRA
jgi:hypothetical protein